MPTYRYQCNECGEDFNLRRASDSRDREAECPDCGSLDTARQMSRFAVGSTSEPPQPACQPQDCVAGSCPFS